MRDNAYEAGRMMFFNIKKHEKLIIRAIIKIMNSEDVDSYVSNELKTLLEEYYSLICHRGSEYTVSICIKSLLRLIRFLLIFPVQNKIDVRKVALIYNEFWLIDMVTYILYQLGDVYIRPVTIDRFMTYVKGTETEIVDIFYLYRICPEYIKYKYCILDVRNLTSKELYYGVSSGYFNIKNGTNDAIKTLICKSETGVLKKLEDEGFWIV